MTDKFDLATWLAELAALESVASPTGEYKTVREIMALKNWSTNKTRDVLRKAIESGEWESARVHIRRIDGAITVAPGYRKKKRAAAASKK